MFYVNNEQVKGIFLNGRNYNYLSYGFGKIIPEDRNSVQLNLNLAYKYLNQYRIEFGTVKDGYENALVSPRFDKPDSNGVFHTPFTYYYGGNIISTKKVNVLINNAHWALLNASVYNDININGNITYFATNTDFLGHNINVFPEGEDEPIYKARLNQPILSNCTNFSFDIQTRFSKRDGYPPVGSCNNFTGNFRYVGNQDRNYPGFMGFLEDCKDGVFNIDCTNMHGGGSSANITNYYNFYGIQSCNNIKLNITGSSWQVWPHDHSFTSNCNINTYNVISGFSYMNDCNFNVVLPKDSNPEMDRPFTFLNNANNCNYNLYATDVNLFNYRSGVGHVAFFENLNNCNLNLQVNNTICFDHSFGNNLHNCSIVFDNIKADLSTFIGLYDLYNCNISGNVESKIFSRSFIERCDGINVNINAAKSSNILAMWACYNVKGNLVCGDMTYIYHSFYQNLNVSGGGLNLINVEHSRFNFNGTNAYLNNVNNTYARVYNTTFNCHNTNYTEIYSDGGNTSVTGLDNCYNLTLSGLTFNTTSLGDSCLLENVYNSNIGFGTADTYYRVWRVENCDIDGFPRDFAYVNNCVFRPFSLRTVGLYGGIVGTWNNTWSHRAIAGIRSMDNISNCRIETEVWNTDGSITFDSVNNMQTSVGAYYNGVVTANLSNYATNIKLNIDCHNLNLGVFMEGPPHGLEYSSISADNIFCNTGNNYFVQMNYGTRIYCENFCNVPFTPVWRKLGDNYQPVLLINNYQHSNAGSCNFNGGICRIGRLNFNGGPTSNMYLGNGTCMFINNVRLNKVEVNNALLFIGSNVAFMQTPNVYNGGLIVNKENWGPAAHYFLTTKSFAWNVWDSGPWGSQSLLNYCKNV